MSKTITVTITEEQEKFLKLFNAEHYPGSENNLCTMRPVFYVQTRKERIIDTTYEDADDTRFYVAEWHEDYNTEVELISSYYDNSCEECPIKIVKYQQAFDARSFTDINGEDVVICDYEDYFKAYGIDVEVNITDIKYEYVDKALFFIKSEAERYMKYQAHNLDHPRIYGSYCGYANNGEYDKFYDLLMSIGDKLNKEQ